MVSYNTVIVGAGPAGLFCAYELAKNSMANVLLLDMGQEFDGRNCEVLNSGTCIQCETCGILSGIGGSAFSFPGKLSVFPAGSKLTGILGNVDECRSVYDYVISIFKQYGLTFCEQIDDKKAIDELRLAATELSVIFKYYKSRLFGRTDFKTFIDSFIYYCKNSITVWSKSKLCKITHLSDGTFKLSVRQGSNDLSLNTKNLVIASGEIGARWWKNNATELEVATNKSSVDIGLRLEFPSTLLNKVWKAHKDFKLIFNAPDGSEIRTYCAINSGKTVICNYGDYKVLDGIADDSGLSNTGSMTIFNRIMHSERACMIEYAFSILQRQKDKNSGIPIHQKLRDLPCKTRDYGLPEFKPSLLFALPGYMSEVIPKEILFNLMYAIERIDCLVPGVADSKNIAYFPLMDKLWGECQIDKNMESNINNLYVIGDTSGHIRGIMQAAVTGVLCARGIVIKTK
jgi:uncharacterized FAD-dependent dehydrogenase